MTKRFFKKMRARNAFDHQMTKERAIGVDPEFDHSRGRTETEREELHNAWVKKSREYDMGVLGYEA